MSDTFRSLCVDLVDVLKLHCNDCEFSWGVIERTEKLLSQSEPEFTAEEDAQAVLEAVVDGAAWPFHTIASPMAAAAIRAAVDRVVPEQCESPAGEGEPWPRDYQLMSDSKWEQRQQIRAKFLAIATELKGDNTTTQENDR
jgi:hypothetical protein